MRDVPTLISDLNQNTKIPSSKLMLKVAKILYSPQNTVTPLVALMVLIDEKNWDSNFMVKYVRN